MLLDLSDQSSETLQQQIIRQVRARILTGELVAGEALPSIRGMARQLRVSVITVDRAYDQLSRQGLISSRRGKGYFVSEVSRKKRTTMARERLDEQLRHLVRGAVAEGLSPDDIRRLLEDALGDSDGD
ncbi:MAG TPA: GntR family transcriptional regulator [Candidatus Latescibacteria bacterium]|nr:GntR family transcriptional regulator [Gemmatimonadaceae bacterium]MDP6018152.1 GntR family transcriptional regulator [Candidatus Latescibacterota bacterium]HJP32410.1 GntR family transcriptional regulator [Candidatus Latescibacterota bacterium]